MEFIQQENKVIMVHAWEQRTSLQLIFGGSLFSFCFQIYTLLPGEYVNFGTGSFAPILAFTIIFGAITLFFSYLIAARRYNKEIIEVSPRGAIRHTKELFLGVQTVSFMMEDGEAIDSVHIKESAVQVMNHGDSQRTYSSYTIVVQGNGTQKKPVGSLESKSFASTAVEAMRVIWNVPPAGLDT